MKRLAALALLLALLPACDPDPAVPAPPAGPTLLEQAEGLMVKHDLAGAKAILEGLHEQGGENPVVTRRLVEIYRAEGNTARAILRARAGLAAHPEAAELYVPLAQMYLEVGQLKEAQAVLAQARERQVDDANVSLLLGACLAKNEDTRGARAEFERAAKAGADEKVVQMNLGLLLVQENQVAEATKVFEELTAKYPKMASAKRELARMLLEQVKQDAVTTKVVDRVKEKRAMDLLWAVKDELASDWRVHEAIGDGWFLEGDYDAALVSYTEALKLGQNPKSVEARYRAAKQRQQELQKAQQEVESSK